MLHLTLKPSRRLAILLTVAHAMSLPVLWVLPQSSIYLIAPSLLLAWSCFHSLRKSALLLAHSSVTGLQFDESGVCRFQSRDGDWQEATLLPSSSVFSWLVVLNFNVTPFWKGRRAVILADSTDAESFRKLRVMLRWKYRLEI